MEHTGVALEPDEVRWLVDVGRCVEAEGRVDDLMTSIRASAGAGVRDPWAYLQRCVSNRGDAWTVSAQLLADVLTWCGVQSLEYAVSAIGGGYVRRPLAYLRRTLQYAVSAGQRPVGWPERPVAMAVSLARRWAPGLAVLDADRAVAGEEEAIRSGFLESYRRRYGRLPWEEVDEPAEVNSPADEPPVVDSPALDCCIGINRGPGDDSLVDSIQKENIEESSPEPFKADAPSASMPDGNRPVADDIGRDEGPCRHPLAVLLVSSMDLDAVRQVECSAGCGHLLYSDRGAVECPCHWSVQKTSMAVGQLRRVLAPARGDCGPREPAVVAGRSPVGAVSSRSGDGVSVVRSGMC